MPVDDERKGARPDYVRRAAEDSLRRLGTDRIDLYQLHEPDPDTPIADTLGALNELVGRGRCARSAARTSRPSSCARRRPRRRPERRAFVSVQNEYSLLDREPEAEVLPECLRLGLAFIPYFPLASGVLTGKYASGEPPAGTRLATYPADRVRRAAAGGQPGRGRPPSRLGGATTGTPSTSWPSPGCWPSGRWRR